MMKTYTLNKLIKSYGKAALVIIIFALIGGLVMGGTAKRKKSTQYTATRQIVISHNISNSNYGSSSGNTSIVNDDNNMMPTYRDIAENGIIASRTRTYLSRKMKKNYSTEQIQEALSAKTTPQSLVMDLRARTSSEKEAVTLVNAASQAFKQELPNLQPGAGNVTLLQKANVDTVKSSSGPSIKKYAVVGLALGGLFGLIVDFIVVTIRNFGKKE